MRTGLYQERTSAHRGIQEISGWRMKIYEIRVSPEPIQESVWEAVRSTVESTTKPPDVEPALGFCVVHAGQDAIWLLANRWRHELLFQTMHAAPLAKPTAFERVPQDGPIGCLWELRIHAHERSAYIRSIFDPPSGPEVDNYLADWAETT